MKRSACVAFLLCVLSAGHARAGEGSFYDDPDGLFSTRPSETQSLTNIARFGPVGVGIDLIQPAFTMRISRVEEGSPAAATRQLEVGQIVDSINGEKLAGIDPRIQLGRILAAAEATDGVLRFAVRNRAGEVVVRIPVLGKYAATWPLDCPKSERIVRGFADYLAKPDADTGFGGIGMLFLLSTGEDKDLPPVREWIRGLAGRPAPTYAWHLGYGGIPLAEYYLRTGDATALPTIRKWVDAAVKGQYLDGWAGRGGVAAVTYGGGGGHLNAGGTAVLTFLLLARECGAEVPDDALRGALVHFFRFAGRGQNPYGDNRPEVGFVDNGKTGNLAFAMAAAASLTPEGEGSLYAAARDACAMTAFYTTTFMLHGHTGGGIGESWRSPAMGLLYDKRPQHYREFMDGRRWHYDLSRRFDGSFGILGGAGYDTTSWGAAYALTYTIPRRTLRIAGAPPSKFSKTYRLPERPWGTAGDDAFLSIEAATDEDGHRQDLARETLARDSGRPVVARLAGNDVDDATVRRYAHHPDYVIRRMAARKAAGLGTTYLGGGAGSGPFRGDLVRELLRSRDPRVRQAAIDAVAASKSGDALAEFLGPEGIDPGILRDPQESWWIKDSVLNLLGRAPADLVAKHLDSVLPYLKHEEWWLRNAALTALAPVVADERCYRQVLPAVGELLRTNQRWNLTAGPMYGIRARLKAGSPAVQKLAVEELEESFTGFAGTRTAPGGQDITRTYDSQLEFIAESLSDVPGGYDVLYDIAKQRFPDDPLPYDRLFLRADLGKLGPGLREALAPIIREQLVYEYVGLNRASLLKEAAAERQSPFLVGPLDGLVDLYRKLGIRNYDWRPFGPDLENAEWEYHAFDPPEKLAYDVRPWRYRAVTLPEGMEHWFAPDFDSAKAGWRTGRTPIGQFQGKLVADSKPCANPSCRHSHPMRTLWEKEVLLVRGTFEFPPPRPGHLYRIRVGTGQHVGSGDGYRLYVNGRPLVETETGVGRREGARPRGAFVTRDFLREFEGGKVTLAATTFLRYGDRAVVTKPAVPQGIFSMWVEEMQLPPLDAETLRRSAAFVPMASMAWQAMQNSNDPQRKPDDDKFRWDGRFVANPRVEGRWQVVHRLEPGETFDPADKRRNPGTPPFREIVLGDDGRTGDPLWIWSGHMLLDLGRNEALAMTPTTIGGEEYLLVEAGGFKASHPPEWRPRLYVWRRR